MRVNATIKVEFEMNPNQPENAAHAALARGLSGLRAGVQGSGVASGVSPNSIVVETIEEKISP
jgi:hypothetical protein